jgi:hypothetical protein
MSRTMKLKIRSAVLLLLVGWTGTPESLAQATNAPSRLTFDAFRVVSDRNIFNPNRYARSTGRPSNQTRTSRPASRVEAISLVGIMAYEKGSFAFFDGTGGNFTKVLQVGGTVGEYTVKQITPSEVKLIAGTNTVDLKVGMQLRREDEGDWFLGETSDTPRRRVVASTRPRTRTISRSGGTGDAGLVGMEGLEPEVIVIDSQELEPQNGETANPNGTNGTNGNANESAEGVAPANGQQVQPEPAGEEITDPVLLRLMQRRQEMQQ